MNDEIARMLRGKLINAAGAAAKIPSGKRVFIGSFCGEPQHLVDAVIERTNSFSDLEIVRMLNLEGSVMGLIADETKGRSFHARSFYQGSGINKSLGAAKRFLSPMNLYSVPKLFKERHLPIHYALIQVSPPDEFGWMNLGVSVDITLAAAQSADVVIAQMNPRMPRVPGYGVIHVRDVDFVVEREEDVLTTFAVPELPGAEAISTLLANLIEDGATLQFSPAFTPDMIIKVLKSKNDLGVHSQFLLDPMVDLVGLGVITNSRKGMNEGKLVASGAVGSGPLYRFLDLNPSIEFRPADYVNHPSIILQHHRMTAVNLATLIDLTGQVAADSLPQNHFADVTGMIDFARGAGLASEGKSIVVVPSRGLDGKDSAIVPELQAGAVTVPASDVTYVVSEYGAVCLFGKNIQERAMAMISIAHPDHRDELFSRAKEIGVIGKERTLREALFGVYPAWMEERVDLKGGTVTIRPVKAVDGRMIQEHFYEMEDKDVESRFFGLRRNFYREDVDGMFLLDYKKNFSVVACTGEASFEKIVGMGIYMGMEGKGTAEVAYTVSREWQGRGLAAVLQKKIVEAARENGLSALVAYIHAANHPMIKLFRKMPYRISTEYEDGMVILTCHLGEPV